IRYLEEGHARGKVVINLERNNEAVLTSGSLATSSSTTMRSYSIALTLIGILLGVTIVPIVLAILFDRGFRRRHPGARPFRWGYYFCLAMFVAGIFLGIFLELGTVAFIVATVMYGVLAWLFARRYHWAWIVLTILSLNPIAWIINFFYLR